jgi:outer membrane protein assembly factor BamE
MHPCTRLDTLQHDPRRSCGRTRLALLGAVLGAAAILSACTSVATVVTPYKIDVQQGNVVTREQAQALQPGMSRLQVRDVLGSPLLVSVFHADRWDYVFTFRRQGQAPQQRKLVVFFKGDVLERFEADELPTEAEFVASLDVRRKSTREPVLQATEEQLKSFEQGKAAPATTAAPATAPLAVPRAYPPLESPGAAR